MDKTGRNGIRIGDLELDSWKDKYRQLANKHQDLIEFYNVDVQYNLKELEHEFFEAVEAIKSLTFIDSEDYLHNAQTNNQTILAEGAQGSLLDIDFGTYPFVTSSNTTAAGACTGLGIAPNKIKDVYGIFKAYTTRVGSGPFPTELFDADGAKMAKVGNEFGATTGRPRRCGWLDLVALKYAVQVNGVTELIMMKADVLSGFKTLKVCTDYNYKGKEISHLPFNIEPENVTPIYKSFKGWQEDISSGDNFEKLPQTLKDYVAFIEESVGVKISIVSVGPDRTETILR
jgi:adenylosuccinate synthase